MEVPKKLEILRKLENDFHEISEIESDLYLEMLVDYSNPELANITDEIAISYKQMEILTKEIIDVYMEVRTMVRKRKNM